MRHSGTYAKTSNRSPRLRSDRGFTLIEIMVVVAVILLVSASAVRGMRSLAKSDLRHASVNLSGAMRYLFDRASITGKQHRLVIDLGAGKYWAEVSEDRFYVPREKETVLIRNKEAEEREEEDRKAKEEAERTQGRGFDAAAIQADEFKPKRPRFAAFRETALKPMTMKSTKFTGVFTPRLAETSTEGQAYVYFFPMGQAEPAIIHLADKKGETTYSLVLHPLTGRVRIYDHLVEPSAEDQYDDEGNRIER